MAFKPSDHFMQITRRQRQPDGSFKQVSNDYLEVKWRVVWLREDYPAAQIVNDLLSAPGQEPAVVRSTITFTHENGEQAVGTGFGQADKQKWGDYLEKAETRAVGRALAMLGYGTQFAQEFEEDDLIVDAPVEPVDRGSRQPAKVAPEKKASSGPVIAEGYTPIPKSDDINADLEAITKRLSAARSLPGIAAVHLNAKDIGISGNAEYKSAMLGKIEKYIEAQESPDKLAQIGEYAEFLEFKGDKYLTEVYVAKMEKIKGKS